MNNLKCSLLSAKPDSSLGELSAFLIKSFLGELYPIPFFIFRRRDQKVYADVPSISCTSDERRLLQPVKEGLCLCCMGRRLFMRLIWCET